MTVRPENKIVRPQYGSLEVRNPGNQAMESSNNYSDLTLSQTEYQGTDNYPRCEKKFSPDRKRFLEFSSYPFYPALPKLQTEKRDVLLQYFHTSAISVVTPKRQENLMKN
jgi:hypothetical protein